MKATKHLAAFLLISVVSMLPSCTTAHDTIVVKESTAIGKEEKNEQTKTPVISQPIKVEEVKIITAPLVIVKENSAVVKQESKPVPKPVVQAPVKKEIAVVVKNDEVKAIITKEVKPVVIAPKPIAGLPKLPKNAGPLIPLVKNMCDTLWPKIPYCSFMGAKIEQESCISLTHSKCWSPYAELKTAREYGFGLGQITVAYKKDGSERFNVWKDLIRIDPILKKKWTWENRFDPELQIRASFIKGKMSYDAIRFDVANQDEHMAFGAVTYNSGSVLIDRRLCIDIKGCDPSRWYNNVEKYSSKSRIAQKGYGKSFFEISREYPRNIMFVRRPKYIPYLDK